MTKDARRRLALLALLGCLCIVFAPGVRIAVAEYRATEAKVAAQHEVVCLNERPGDVGRWQDERGRWHTVKGIETVGGRH